MVTVPFWEVVLWNLVLGILELYSFVVGTLELETFELEFETVPELVVPLIFLEVNSFSLDREFDLIVDRDDSDRRTL